VSVEETVANAVFTREGITSVVLIATILVATILVSFLFLGQGQTSPAVKETCYVGVAFCGNTSAEARLLIDRVKSYTNLLVLQSGPVSKNETATNEVCDYAVAAGLKIVVFFGDLNPRVLTNQTSWRTDWVKTARQHWNDSLLGVYYYDEPGGTWLATDWSNYTRFIPSNSTCSSIAQRFIRGFQRDPGTVLLKNNSIPIFVSDFALYWFDYLSGYDTVLAEVGWNRSLPQDIAMVRGAATLQNKKWGVIIGWKYTTAPYYDSGDAIYQQMVDSYQAGAQYIVLFDYPQLADNPYGALKDEHFAALENFWKNVVVNPQSPFGNVNAEAALVLPKDYGCGMNSIDDKIWGIWPADDNASAIWNISLALLSRYGLNLDIVYDDANFPLQGNYTKVYWWNQTVVG
jgi:hypothetical protein